MADNFIPLIIIKICLALELKITQLLKEDRFRMLIDTSHPKFKNMAQRKALWEIIDKEVGKVGSQVTFRNMKRRYVSLSYSNKGKSGDEKKVVTDEATSYMREMEYFRKYFISDDVAVSNYSPPEPTTTIQSYLDDFSKELADEPTRNQPDKIQSEVVEYLELPYFSDEEKTSQYNEEIYTSTAGSTTLSAFSQAENINVPVVEERRPGTSKGATKKNIPIHKKIQKRKPPTSPYTLDGIRVIVDDIRKTQHHAWEMMRVKLAPPPPPRPIPHDIISSYLAYGDQTLRVLSASRVGKKITKFNLALDEYGDDSDE